MKLIMEDFRCFAGRHEVEIRPLTLLVGENSSGKTSFLAALSIVNGAHYRFASTGVPLFNEEGYNLGNYRTIAYNSGSPDGPVPSFSLGLCDPEIHEPIPGDSAIVATYRDIGGMPMLAEVAVTVPSGALELAYERRGESVTVRGTVKADRRLGTVTLNEDADPIELTVAVRNVMQRDPEAPQELRRDVHGVTDWNAGYPGLRSSAPIRSRPRRTYDSPPGGYSPEGDDAPYLLPGALRDKTYGEVLSRFGREAGLFSSLRVDQWRDDPASPFQVLVEGLGPPANLVDVGYGVSQVLPIVVTALPMERGNRYLVQQPEVHLHPRAQAALGSFFSHRVAAGHGEFVVETHSDYIVDRVRQHVAKGDIRPADVSILYFEKRSSDAAIHRINLDDGGNVVGPPPGYRDFFMKERMNLLTRGSAK